MKLRKGKTKSILEPFTVTEFLTEVRRIVTDFALGKVLHGASTSHLKTFLKIRVLRVLRDNPRFRQ